MTIMFSHSAEMLNFVKNIIRIIIIILFHTIRNIYQFETKMLKLNPSADKTDRKVKTALKSSKYTYIFKKIFTVR